MFSVQVKIVLVLDALQLRISFVGTSMYLEPKLFIFISFYTIFSKLKLLTALTMNIRIYTSLSIMLRVIAIVAIVILST
jgi:hypothetical protein